MWKRAQHKQIREQNEGILLVAKILNEEFLLFIVAEYAWDNVARCCSFDFKKIYIFQQNSTTASFMKQHNHKQSFREYVVVEYHECLCTNRVDSKYFPAKISQTKTSSSLLFDYEIFEKKKKLKNISMATKNLCYRFYFQQHLFCIFASKQRSFVYIHEFFHH